MDYSAQHKRLARPPSKKEVGNLGEDIAVRYLERLGYEIRLRNLRLGKDEIDVLAFDPADKVLVFAEVKTRSQAGLDFHPEMDAHPRKLARIRRSARRYVREQGYEGGYRLDLVCIVAGRVTDHMKELDWGEEEGN